MSKINSSKLHIAKIYLYTALCIADGNLSHQPEVKLLGVIFNQHHIFDSHIDAVIEKSAIHTMIKFKRSGVNPSSLALFYRARILSVLSYSHMYQIMAKLNLKGIKNIVQDL